MRGWRRRSIKPAGEPGERHQVMVWFSGLLLAMAGAMSPAGAQAGADSITRLPTRSILVSVVPVTGAVVGSGVPARAQVIAKDQLVPAGARSLPVALGRTAGLAAYDDLGSPLKLTITSRGFAASPVVGLAQGISVFVDGVRVNEPEASQVNFDLLPLDHVARVEVLHGTSALLGRNSLGGAVNLVTRGGRDAPRASVDVSSGDYGSRRGGATIGGSRGDADWFVGLGEERERGWRQATEARQRHLFLSSGKGDTRRLRGMAYVADSRASTAGSLPESVYDVRPDSNLSADDYEDLGQVHLSASGWVPVARGEGHGTLFLRRHGAERFNRNQPDDPDIFSRSENRSLGGVFDWRRTWLRGSVRAGVEATATDVAIDIYRDSVKFGRGREQSTRVTSAGFEAAGFLLGEVNYRRATLTAGVRADHLRSPYRNRLEPRFDTVNTFRRLSPRLGGSVALRQDLSVHASWGQAFRAPSILELACSNPERPCPLPFALGDDPPLAPVVVRQGEVGATWTKEGARLAAAVFRSDARDDIYLLGSEVELSGSSIDGYFANIGDTRRVGAEVDAELALGGGVTAYGSWTGIRATFQSEAEIFSLREDEDAGIENEVEVGDRVPLVPSQVAKVGVAWRHARGLGLAADLRFVGRRFLRGDEANDTSPLDGYAVTDLHLSWGRGPIALTASIRNATEQRYPSFGGFNVNQGYSSGPKVERFLTPGEPRWINLGIRWTRDR
jgi:outer membrane receptor protein involved in Fe transport